MDFQTVIAAAIFAIAIILLISMMKKKLLHGGSCCGEHEAPEKRVKVADKNIKHYGHHYEINIEGMVCSNCATRVENALNKKEGTWMHTAPPILPAWFSIRVVLVRSISDSSST